MSHIDTAYKLGALQAYNDFVAEAEKQALQATPPPRIEGGQAPIIPGKPVAPTKRPAPIGPDLPNKGTGTRLPPATPIR